MTTLDCLTKQLKNEPPLRSHKAAVFLFSRMTIAINY